MDVEALLAREASKRGLRLSDLRADMDEKQGSLSLSNLELISSISTKTMSIDRKALPNGEFENGGVKIPNGRTHNKMHDSKRISFKASCSRNDIDEEENSDSAESTASSGILRSSTSSSPKSVGFH